MSHSYFRCHLADFFIDMEMKNNIIRLYLNYIYRAVSQVKAGPCQMKRMVGSLYIYTKCQRICIGRQQVTSGQRDDIQPMCTAQM